MLIDEYGSVVGMVTLENVLEELVGPIQDEFDRETPPITPIGENVFEVDASCPLDVLAETCGIEVPETDAETAGGLVLDFWAGWPSQATVSRSTASGSRFSAPIPTRIRKIRLEPPRPRSGRQPERRRRGRGGEVD